MAKSRKEMLGDSLGKQKSGGHSLPATKEGEESPSRKKVVEDVWRNVSAVEVDGVEYVNH